MFTRDHQDRLRSNELSKKMTYQRTTLDCGTVSAVPAGAGVGVADGEVGGWGDPKRRNIRTSSPVVAELFQFAKVFHGLLIGGPYS